ncbi:CpsD/CapB family tyrosine-protein kinase [Clostridium estertheticum]|uniref:CpsD/CapB family tyrosine-protein kinase n=1 Tax=Clostridium TaxID=1485 RepID=UPI0013EE48D6|nr:MULTISPECIES: CpsD/CapB family tyrosine-protein kinase [Clostridium]MBW9146115.1 CpsD/CapB family tyrosine-protein kinase [Clostridium sp. CM027]MBZ9607784.1 CpsD/CapB family tyrosine-protein kinase [Clostridium estertheticum]UVE41708.1 CpsD/CapB family tyrosine-protein kinase [Clostridium sp. CM027]
MLKKLVTLRNPKSRTAEAFRTLRTNIQFSSLDKEYKSIVVTSSGVGEGKSTVMSNLAITMAESGKNVILVDCDFRKPSIHKKMGITNSVGLTNILVQGVKKEECVVKSTVNNLFILTSGPVPPNPAELLGSKKMRDFIEVLKSEFDLVLIDAPPVLAVTDAQIISTIVDGVIFVASYGEAQKKALVDAKQLIDKVGGKILGVVFNKVPQSVSGYYGKYYKGYYGNEN